MNTLTFKIKKQSPLPVYKEPVKIPTATEDKITGLGDVIAKVAEPIKGAIMKYGPAQLQNYLSECKCAERRAALNKRFPLNVK